MPLFHMPLALAVAIGQTSPLMILVLSVVFLRERVIWQRWAAVLVGFAAVLLVARPGTAGFTSVSYTHLDVYKRQDGR